MIGKNAALVINAFLLTLLLMKGMPKTSVRVLLGPTARVLVGVCPAHPLQ